MNGQLGSAATEQIWFNHEKLDAYQEALQFVAWASLVLDRETHCGDMRVQLERASGSIVLNIAEGNGKFTPRDRCRFFDSAHGSALECAAALDVLVARRKLTASQVQTGRARLQQIVRLLMGLIKRNSERDYTRSSGQREMNVDSAAFRSQSDSESNS